MGCLGGGMYQQVAVKKKWLINRLAPLVAVAQWTSQFLHKLVSMYLLGAVPGASDGCAAALMAAP